MRMPSIFKRLFPKREQFPVIFSALKFRENGDVDLDPNSRDPTFVEYNNMRLLIQKAKDAGKKFVASSISSGCWNELRRDGYVIAYDKSAKHKERHLITW